MNDTAARPADVRVAFSEVEFQRRARSRLDFTLPVDVIAGRDAILGDHSLDGAPHPSGRLRPAAVLIALVMHPAGATMILTERPAGMRDHAGQIAFPGGKVEPGDSSPLEAALREAEEEIGLDRSHLDPIGYLDPYVTGTGFRIVPTLAIATPPFRLAPDPREVADAFEVPLAFLMNPANHQRHRREIGGRWREFCAMPFEGRFIWGATAGMVRNLYERLHA